MGSLAGLHRREQLADGLVDGGGADLGPVAVEVQLGHVGAVGAGHGHEDQPDRLALLGVGPGDAGGADAPVGVEEPAYALGFLERGSDGRAYLLKERVSDLEQVRRAIVAVHEGGSVIDPKVVDALVASRSRSPESPVARLTPRERDVLAEMAQGKNNAGIAASLVLTERAVEKHINSMFAKLGVSEETDVHRRVKAVLLYLGEDPSGR